MDPSTVFLWMLEMPNSRSPAPSQRLYRGSAVVASANLHAFVRHSFEDHETLSHVQPFPGRRLPDLAFGGEETPKVVEFWEHPCVSAVSGSGQKSSIRARRLL